MYSEGGFPRVVCEIQEGNGHGGAVRGGVGKGGREGGREGGRVDKIGEGKKDEMR